MALRNVATLLAEGLSMDAVSGRLSVFNMMESVSAPKFPAFLAKLVVVSLYEEDEKPAPYWERVTVLDDTGERLAQVITEFAVEGFAHRSMGMFQGLKLAKPGTYTVLVEGATRKDGPWNTVNKRYLRAEIATHPLVHRDEANPQAGMVSGHGTITD